MALDERLGLLMQLRWVYPGFAVFCLLATLLVAAPFSFAEVLPFGLKIEKVFDHSGEAGDLSVGSR